MVIYVKDDQGKLKTLADIAIEYNLPLDLVRQRYSKGLNTYEILKRSKNDPAFYQRKKGPNRE
jgi:hypothetical protein